MHISAIWGTNRPVQPWASPRGLQPWPALGSPGACVALRTSSCSAQKIEKRIASPNWGRGVTSGRTRNAAAAPPRLPRLRAPFFESLFECVYVTAPREGGGQSFTQSVGRSGPSSSLLAGWPAGTSGMVGERAERSPARRRRSITAQHQQRRQQQAREGSGSDEGLKRQAPARPPPRQQSPAAGGRAFSRACGGCTGTGRACPPRPPAWAPAGCKHPR